MIQAFYSIYSSEQVDWCRGFGAGSRIYKRSPGKLLFSKLLSVLVKNVRWP